VPWVCVYASCIPCRCSAPDTDVGVLFTAADMFALLDSRPPVVVHDDDDALFAPFSWSSNRAPGVVEPDWTGDTYDDVAAPAATSALSVRVALVVAGLFLSGLDVPISRICCINWYCAAIDLSKSSDLSAAMDLSRAAAAAAAAGDGGSARVGDDTVSATILAVEFGPLFDPCSGLLVGF
jgi:hypothetical protein